MRCYLALPSYDQRYWGNTLMSVLHAVEEGTDIELFPDPLSGSVTPRVFNSGLLKAVRDDYDCLAILHADVAAQPGWLSRLWWEMREHEADVISAIVPLKDGYQWTSTAVHTNIDLYRKLLLSECHNKLPTTFDVNAPWLQGMHAHTLLLNTGCMLMRLDRAWLYEWQGFQFRSCIDWDALTQDTCSEDWLMSEQLSWMGGVRLMATTAVRTHHWGPKEYASHDVHVDTTEHPYDMTSGSSPPAGQREGL
jgi:hypothetical protein